MARLRGALDRFTVPLVFDKLAPVLKKRQPLVLDMEGVGGGLLNARQSVVQFIYLMREIFYQGVVAPFKGAKPRGQIFLDQIGRLGAGSAPIVWLVALLVGLTTAFQSAHELRQFGANIYVADLVAISMMRELGPLMAATLVAGRSGAAITAEIGTMRVTEELDAMKLIGINPIQYLAVPRIYAVVITQAFLGVTSAVVGIVGGLVIAMYYLDLSVAAFVVEAVGSLTVDDLLHNLSKSMIFGVIIVVVGVFVTLAGIKLMEASDMYKAQFDESVSGLEIGAQVKYNGVRVGQVASIKNNPEKIVQVTVLLELDKGTPVKTDTEAVLMSMGITGLKFVELAGGSDEAALLLPGDTIRTGHSFMGSMEGKAEDIAVKVELAVSKVNAVLSENNIAHFNDILLSIKGFSHGADVLLSENDDKFTGMIDDLTLVSKDLKKGMASAGRSAETVEEILTDSKPDVTAILTNVNRTATSIRVTVERWCAKRGQRDRRHDPIGAEDRRSIPARTSSSRRSL